MKSKLTYTSTKRKLKDEILSELKYKSNITMLYSKHISPYLQKALIDLRKKDFKGINLFVTTTKEYVIVNII